MKLDRLISVVAPIRDSAPILNAFIDEVLTVLQEHFAYFEIILVDDGSSASSQVAYLELLQVREGVRLIQLSRSFGDEIAISAGIESAIGDYVVVINPYTDPPTCIPGLVEKCVEGYDISFGIARETNLSRPIYRLLASAFYGYCRKFLNLDIPPNATQLKCLSRRAVNALLRIQDPSRNLRVFSSIVGFKRIGIDYKLIQRDGAKRRRSIVSSIGLAIGIIFENSVHPLRLVTWLGIAAMFANLAYMLYIVAVFMLKEDVMPGWTTLSMQNAAQFCVITGILAALAEYVGRILSRLQDRPMYFVVDEHEGKLRLPGDTDWNVVEAAHDPSTRPNGTNETDIEQSFNA